MNNTMSNENIEKARNEGLRDIIRNTAEGLSVLNQKLEDIEVLLDEALGADPQIKPEKIDVPVIPGLLGELSMVPYVIHDLIGSASRSRNRLQRFLGVESPR